MSRCGQNAQSLVIKTPEMDECMAMSTANVTNCPRNMASADTDPFRAAQPETRGPGNGCVLARPLLCGHHWGMMLFINHFPSSHSCPAPGQVTGKVNVLCKD